MQGGRLFHHLFLLLLFLSDPFDSEGSIKEGRRNNNANRFNFFRGSRVWVLWYGLWLGQTDGV
jgi:hypothetical protein